jgi:phosphohistidine phosphatase SixA
MHTLYLVRHAHTNGTAGENRPLSSKGMRDARRVADILEERPITIVYSSPYTRACQTIEPIVVKLGVGTCMDERLRERELVNTSPSLLKKLSVAPGRTWITLSRVGKPTARLKGAPYNGYRS